MTSFAPLPSPEETPEGMVHVGWRCASPDHDCLVPLSRAVGQPDDDGDVYLYDANHHAYWTPVFARAKEDDRG